MKADWSSSDRGVTGIPLRGEHLVPVVADPTTHPAIATAAGSPIGFACVAAKNGSAAGERQSSSNRRPVLFVSPASDVHGLGVARVDDVSQAQVQAEAPQGAEATGQPADLDVALQRLLAQPARRPPRDLEAVGEFGDRMLQALRDGREVLLVLGDEIGSPLAARWSARSNALVLRGFVGEFGNPAGMAWSFWLRPPILGHDRGLAASPPLRYTLGVEGSDCCLSVCREGLDPKVDATPCITPIIDIMSMLADLGQSPRWSSRGPAPESP